MHNEQIKIVDGTAKMVVNGKEKAAVRLSEVRRLFVVHFLDSLFHGEEPYFVLIFDDCLWVVRDDVEGVGNLLAEIQEPLEAVSGLFRATSPPRPWVWRRRLAGFLPLFPMPRLAKHPLNTIPKWKEEGPFAIAELPEMTVGAIRSSCYSYI